MTIMHTSTIDELCNTLGLRAAYPVPRQAPEPLSDEQITALGVLAAPEAIAIVSQRGQARTPVIATRGPWLAEHTIDGTTHHVRAAAADDAPALLLERCGFVDDADARRGAIDMAIAAYRRVQELVRADDVARARATLVSEGASLPDADAFARAMRAGIVDIAGLGSDGRRFTGCDLAVAGDAATGRWLVPTVQHVDPLPRSVFHHPSFHGVRVLVERAETEALCDELALIFGEA
jgi:hypothetical protein